MNHKNYIEVIISLNANSNLLRISNEEFVNVQMEMKGVPYNPMGGSLMNVMVTTRADIAFAVSIVSQFMSKAGPAHWMAVLCIMRYLKGTLDFK